MHLPRRPPLRQPLWVFITFVFFVCRNKFIFYFRFFTRDLSHCARLSFLKSDFSLASQLNVLRLFGAHVCTFNEIPWVALLFLVIFPTVLSLARPRPHAQQLPSYFPSLSIIEVNCLFTIVNRMQLLRPRGAFREYSNSWLGPLQGIHLN